MARCCKLHRENEELRKEISSGRIAKLECELALQKNFAEEIKTSQKGINLKIFLFLYIYICIKIFNFIIIYFFQK